MRKGDASWLCCAQGPEHSSARLERFLQMVDENPYKLPEVDESKWFTGGHLGGQIQQINWQVSSSSTGGSVWLPCFACAPERQSAVYINTAMA